MKKSFLWALVAGAVACAVHAEVVTPGMAMAAANEWAERNAQFGTGNGATNVVTVCDTNVAETVLFHQVSMSGGGCLIVAPVTEIEPVVAALERDPGNLNEGRLREHPLRGILSIDMRRRLRFLNLYEEDSSSRLLSASASSGSDVGGDFDEAAAEKDAVRRAWAEQQEAKWGKLLPASSGGSRLLAVDVKKGVAKDDDMPVKVIVPGFEHGGMFTHWDQSGNGFDLYTPGNSVCGCVAVSVGAVVQFFNVKKGPDKKSNMCSFNGVRSSYTTMGGDYNWSIMPSNWGGEAEASSSLNEEQKDLMGRVAYDSGVAVGMAWTIGSSGAIEKEVVKAFRNFFGFKEARCVNNPAQEQYAKLIYAQCRSGAPVVMGIEKHSVLAVGYGKDVDGVERVRVFLGWGGSGDGWYALPYINTKSTTIGSTYLSETLDCIITMIGYASDNVVPVYGRVYPTNNLESVEMRVGGRPAMFNESGLFGGRVSASMTQGKQASVEIVRIGDVEGQTTTNVVKAGSVTIGEDPGRNDSYMSSSGGLCKWVPDAVFFPIVQSEVALSFVDARQKAIDSLSAGNPKAVIALSGTFAEDENPTNVTTATIASQMVWEYLLDKDGGNVNDFTNKYIVLCTPYSESDATESDGNPSIGIFDGRSVSLDPNKVWSYYNGRLAYWTIGNSIYTNEVGFVDSPVTNDFKVSSATNKVLNGEVDSYVTGELIINALDYVLKTGTDLFEKGTSGITLAVTNNCFGDNPGVVDPDYGILQKTIVNGTVVTATASEYATNSAGNVEFKCVGWTLASTNSAEVITNVEASVTKAEFTPVPDGAYTLTWMWKTNKVLIATNVRLGTGTDGKGGTVEPAGGWHPFGERVTFIARPAPADNRGYYLFDNWVVGDLDTSITDYDEIYSVAGNICTFTVAAPVSITANFRQQSTRDPVKTFGTFSLTVENAGDASHVPATLVGGTAVPYGVATNLLKVTTDVVLSTNEFTNAGGTWRCSGWELTEGDNVLDLVYIYDGSAWTLGMAKDDETGEDVSVMVPDTRPSSMVGLVPNDYGITNGADVVLTWLWMKTGEGGSSGEEDDISNAFDIVWNDSLDNLNTGYTTNLLTAAQLASKGWSADDLSVTAPTGWIASVALNGAGDAVATLSRNDAALEKAMETCSLTIEPGDDAETFTVTAVIEGALRGFWYVLYGSDDLYNWTPVESGVYETGMPALQADGINLSVVPVTLQITVKPDDAGVKRFYKVVSGATDTPLEE